jgi:hypothetical protein
METESMNITNNQKANRIEEIRSVTRDVRKERIETDHDLDYQTVQNEVATRKYHDPLLGECQQNTIALADKLTQHGYTVDIIWGALREPQSRQSATQDLPESIKEIQTNIHFWVEIPTTENNIDKEGCIIAEICKEPTGQWHVTTTLPDAYHRPTGSRIRYKHDEIAERDLKSYTGYEKLVEKGLVVN